MAVPRYGTTVSRPDRRAMWWFFTNGREPLGRDPGHTGERSLSNLGRGTSHRAGDACAYGRCKGRTPRRHLESIGTTDPRDTRSSPPRAEQSGRSEASRARRAWSRGARIVEHVGRLEPDEATIRTGERERLRASVDRGAAGDVLERDALVPAMPVLTATEGTRYARVAAPQEIKDALRGLSYLPLRSPEGAERLSGRVLTPQATPVRREAPSPRARRRVGGCKLPARDLDAGQVRAP